MQRNFSTQLKDWNGEPLFNFQPLLDDDGNRVIDQETRQPKTKKEPVTLWLVALNSISQGTKEKIGMDEARRRYKLLSKIQKAEEKEFIDVTTDDISLIKKLVLEQYASPLIFGQVDELLEGETEEEKAARNRAKG